MKKITASLLLLTIINVAFCQSVLKLDADGLKLKEFYLKQHVENLWIAGHHINWETGEPDDSAATKGIKTHCSAFVASVCKQEGIYILRPPVHKTELLANAQYNWLLSDDAAKEGWVQIKDSVYAKAQELANKGFIVAAVYKNPNPKKPGHIALVMPLEKSLENLSLEGPTMIQAGNINSNYIPLRQGFKHHIIDWALAGSEILFFYNKKYR